MCRTYGARLDLAGYPPFRLRMRLPSGWANLWSRLRRLDPWCMSQRGCRNGDVTVAKARFRDSDATAADAMLLPRCGSGADPSLCTPKRATSAHSGGYGCGLTEGSTSEFGMAVRGFEIVVRIP
jgi:hypothetical protein